MKRERKSIDEVLKSVISSLLKDLEDADEVVLENVTLDVEELTFELPSTLLPLIEKKVIEEKPIEITPEKAVFEEPTIEWKGRIVEVKIGAGSRKVTYVVGGEEKPRFYSLNYTPPHKPILSMDVFDTRIPLPKAVKDHFKDLLDNPTEWAAYCVEKLGADMVNIHLVSTDPNFKDTTPREAAKVVEEILQRVNTPLCVGGSGHPKKDVEVFKVITEITSGERIIINSVNLDMKLEEIAPLIKKHGHVVVAFVPMDLDKARQLVRKLRQWLDKEDILLDMNTAGIGYGWEYAFTATERARLAALKGDEELQHPLVSAVSNSWTAREAWMKMPEYWGLREVRGPLWEILTGISSLIAGADYLMILHPLTLKILKTIVNQIFEIRREVEIAEWISKKL